jgi:cysteinyl-tRNA synthetase
MALSVLFNMVNECNKILDNSQEDSVLKLMQLAAGIKELGCILGLSFVRKDNGEPDAWVGKAIEEREKLRKEKKYKEADDVRKMLEEKGIVLEDTKEGTVWRRKI